MSGVNITTPILDEIHKKWEKCAVLERTLPNLLVINVDTFYKFLDELNARYGHHSMCPRCRMFFDGDSDIEYMGMLVMRTLDNGLRVARELRDE